MEVQMLKSRFFIAYMLVTVLLSACAAKPGAAIIGKWERGGAITEFKNDGTVNVTTNDGAIINGSYKFTDSTTMQLMMPEENGGTGVFTVSISGDNLVLSNDSGSGEYTRVK
jgi:hypothetical protein